MGMEPAAKKGYTVVAATAPKSELMDYPISLRAMTQGRGSFDFEVNDYDVVPAQIAAKIKESIDLDPRVTVLGHIQRGGSPTGRDRVNATKMGYLAVELLLEGKTNRIVSTNKGGYVDVDIDEALQMKRSIQNIEVDVLAAMTGI